MIKNFITEIGLLPYLYVYSCIICFNSCQKNTSHTDIPLRTIIVYMIADNNLDYFSLQDINEMEAGFDNKNNGNLIVYVDRAEGANPSHPVVYKISNDSTDIIKSDISFVYNEQNSAHTTVMHNVLSDIIKAFPAQSYGLILWSHGTSWYPEGMNISENNFTIKNSTNQQLPVSKAFGRDGSSEMLIKDLKEALPVFFEFIIFDACYMSSIEVVYELKNNTNYIISSPTEVLSAGYPYTHIVNRLFEPSINYSKIAHDFFVSYDTLSHVMQSATVSVINTDKLQELAALISNIMNDTLNLKKVNTFNIQQYTVNKGNYIFDLGDFISNVSLDFKKIEHFKKKLSETIIYKAATQMIFEELKIKKYSGLSIFIPTNSNCKYHDYYKTLSWYKDSDYYNYFTKYNLSD